MVIMNPRPGSQTACVHYLCHIEFQLLHWLPSCPRISHPFDTMFQSLQLSHGPLTVHGNTSKSYPWAGPEAHRRIRDLPTSAEIWEHSHSHHLSYKYSVWRKRVIWVVFLPEIPSPLGFVNRPFVRYVNSISETLSRDYIDAYITEE
jgi:hypothetical protein